jgi:hypothetical protein
MSYNNEALESRISAFMSRKEREFPELTDVRF